MALLTFAAGFAVRPFGAIVFGRLGDMIGRKVHLLVTIVLMGISTFWWACCPRTKPSASPHRSSGDPALRAGPALGGEYGGAATSPNMRHMASAAVHQFHQTTATVGLFLSLLVILGCRLIGNEAFAEWGWRIRS